jgi:hypothetical protein
MAAKQWQNCFLPDQFANFELEKGVLCIDNRVAFFLV